MQVNGAYVQIFENMKLIFVTFLGFSLGKALSAIPEKLLLYQNVTGIDDQTVWKIFNNQTLGEKTRIEQFSRLILGLYDNTYPKFRYTGTAPEGDIAPVVWSTEKLNVDAVVNGGVFLCLRPGYYHFTAGMSAASYLANKIGITLSRNSLRQSADK